MPLKLSVTYTPRFQETLINGVLQGRPQFDPRGASLVSRRKMWSAVAEVIVKVGVPHLGKMVSEAGTYTRFKQIDRLRGRADVKAETTTVALRGWIPNDVDDFSCI